MGGFGFDYYIDTGSGQIPGLGECRKWSDLPTMPKQEVTKPVNYAKAGSGFINCPGQNRKLSYHSWVFLNSNLPTILYLIPNWYCTFYPATVTFYEFLFSVTQKWVSSCYGERPDCSLHQSRKSGDIFLTTPMQEVALVHLGLVEMWERFQYLMQEQFRRSDTDHRVTKLRQKEEHRGPREIRLCARNTLGSLLLCANEIKTPVIPFTS